MALPPPLRSASHPLARQVRALARGPRERRSLGMFLIEGPRCLEEALAAEAALVFVLVAAGRVQSSPHAPLVEKCLRRRVPVQPVQDGLLERLLAAEHGQGLAAACRLPAASDDPERVLGQVDDGLIVVTWQVQNPGNLGALVRSAAAFGAKALVAAGGADPWSPKAVRGAAGAIHRLPVARLDDAGRLAALLAEHRFRTIAASARGGAPPDKTKWSGRAALLMGAEVAGLPPELLESADLVTIPTTGAVESLSVAAAGSILLERAHAAGRKRRERR